MKEAENAVITVVYDNHDLEGSRLGTGWGFGCVVDHHGKRVLFDTGGDGDVLASNMALLGIDPATVDAVVLSHVHTDHRGGLTWFLEQVDEVPVYVPDAFPAGVKHKIRSLGGRVVEVDGPVEVFDSIRTTGEMGSSIREQGLILEMSGGFALITGCAHPGITKMLKRAFDLVGKMPSLVMGGFHLKDSGSREVRRIIEVFRDQGVDRVAPCHCTGTGAIKAFKEAFGDNYTTTHVGTVVHIP